MHIKTIKTKILLLISAGMFAACLFILPAPSYALDNLNGIRDSAAAQAASQPASSSSSSDPADLAAKNTDCVSADGTQCLKNSSLFKYLMIIVNAIGALAGTVISGAIIYGGIKYMSAGGNSKAVADARKAITNAVIALVAFLFVWSFLNWLVPSGILHK